MYDDRNLIIFVRITLDPDVVCEAFNEKYGKFVEAEASRKDSPKSSPRLSSKNTYRKRKHSEPEVCGITWLTWEEFQRSIKERGVLFSRVQKFLARADNFAYLL